MHIATMISILLLHAATTCLAEGGLVTLNDRGALAMLYWATGGPSWRQSWPINDAHSDPCRDNVRVVVNPNALIVNTYSGTAYTAIFKATLYYCTTTIFPSY